MVKSIDNLYTSEEVMIQYKILETEISNIEDDIENYRNNKQWTYYDKAIKRFNNKMDKLNQLSEKYHRLKRLGL